MKVGDQIKVLLGGETLWVEMLEEPNPDGRWPAKLLNDPLFAPVKWGDTVTVVTDIGIIAELPTRFPHVVDVSEYGHFPGSGLPGQPDPVRRTKEVKP